MVSIFLGRVSKILLLLLLPPGSTRVVRLLERRPIIAHAGFLLPLLLLAAANSRMHVGVAAIASMIVIAVVSWYYAGANGYLNSVNLNLGDNRLQRIVRITFGYVLPFVVTPIAALASEVLWGPDVWAEATLDPALLRVAAWYAGTAAVAQFTFWTSMSLGYHDSAANAAAADNTIVEVLRQGLPSGAAAPEHRILLRAYFQFSRRNILLHCLHFVLLIIGMGTFGAFASMAFGTPLVGQVSVTGGSQILLITTVETVAGFSLNLSNYLAVSWAENTTILQALTVAILVGYPLADLIDLVFVKGQVTEAAGRYWDLKGHTTAVGESRFER